MAEFTNENPRPVNPRRKERSQIQVFKEVYLPIIIAGLAGVMILIFIIGSIVRAVQKNRFEKQENIAASIASQEDTANFDKEAQTLLKQAKILANDYQYQEAIDLLYTFSGNLAQYTNVNDAIIEYEHARDAMVAWDDPSKVVNLSFNMLMVDPAQSLSHSYGASFNRNYVTTTEFSRILEQLYSNGYILVSFSDIYTATADENGTVTYAPNTLYLPEDKKPLILTQTNVNYHYYIADPNKDGVPDQDAAGFACKLVLDESGNVTAQRVDQTGQLVTGAYDLVPILENFIKTHPDFSYKGARAILAVTGEDGLLGYRTQPNALGFENDANAHNQEIEQATKVANALRKNGYEFACYTYANIAYGSSGTYTVEEDLNKWLKECLPILGQVDIMAFAVNSDISDPGEYSGEKFNLLQNAGFSYYLGFCTDGTPWNTIGSNYIRQGRILVSGGNMEHNAQWFTGIFNPETVLDRDIRGDIPTP